MQKSKKHHISKKYYIWDPSTCTCTCKNIKYLESITGDLVTTYGKILEVTKTFPTKTVQKHFHDKKITCKIENLFILFSILLMVTMSLLIIVNI